MPRRVRKNKGRKIMANLWKNKFNRNNKSTYDISKEINVPEEKVKEIIRGERQVPTKDIDRVNEAFTNNKTERITSFERAMMEKFFIDNNYKDLKKKFGYKTFKELTDAIGVGASVIYDLKEPNIKTLSDNALKKVYDFFQNEWNIKKVPKYKQKNKRNCYYQLPKKMISSEVIEWYEKSDLKQLRENKNLKVNELLEKIGYTSAYGSTYYKFETKLENPHTTNWLLVQQLYNYYHGLELLNTLAESKEELYNNKPVIENKEENEPIEEMITIQNETRKEKYKYNAELSVPTDDRYETLLKEYQLAIKELNRYKYLIDRIMEKE